MYCYDLNELCEHTDMLKLPYSGELCKSCNSIIIDDDFDKHLTRQNFYDIMRVLAFNYEGDITKNKDWIKQYKFVNTDELNKKVTSTYETCRHKNFEEINGIYFCVGCGLVVEDKIKFVSDIESICNSYKRSKVVSPLQRQINEFQGKCDTTTITVEVYRDLREHFLGKTNITKNDLREALKKLKYQKQYNAIHYIHNILTGVPKNDISMYEKRLIDDCKYLMYSFGEKTLNIQHLMYLLLNNYDCEYDRSEFNIPKSALAMEEDIARELPE